MKVQVNKQAVKLLLLHFALLIASLALSAITGAIFSTFDNIVGVFVFSLCAAFSVMSFLSNFRVVRPIKGDGKLYSLLGALATGAGVTTTFAGQSQMENLITIGDVATANPLSGLRIEVGGVSFINITGNQALITAIGKFLMESVNGPVGFLLKVGTGMVAKSTTYSFTNAGATTPNIFVSSDAKDGVPFEMSTTTINPNSYDDFAKFSAIFLGTPANISTAEIEYIDGHRATMSIQEVDAVFALTNQTDALGRLGGISVISNTEQNITSVRINTNSTAGGCVVAVVKLPDAAFKALTRFK
jgi:hypothetical protein